MGTLRKGGRDLIVIAVIVAVLVVALTDAIGSASDQDRIQDGFASERFGFSGGLPDGWSRSAKRLVPLLLPKEILSVGTGPMPIGGGGNCGREPVAAIARMKPGDALISIQEYGVTRRMRARMAETYPLLDLNSSVDRLGVRRYAAAQLGPVAAASRAESSDPAGRYWSADLTFRDDGRVFDALVYFRGPPSAGRLEQVVSILGGLDFRPGVYVGGPGNTTAIGGAGRSEARLAVTYGPYLGVRCRQPNVTRCDRVGIDVVLKERAIGVSASIGGRRLPLRTPGLHSGVRGMDWVGDLAPAGLARKGSPLYLGAAEGHWAGDPPVYVPIRITATYGDGSRRSTTFSRVPLRPGWG